MESFVIEGGKALKGSITPQGAKNEALQILCAVLLTADKITIHNIPDIVDVNKLINLLKNLGVKITQLGPGSYQFQSDALDLNYLNSDQFKIDGKGLRGSIMLVGPLLARFGKGSIPRPGGDKIGRRRLDTHFEGLIQLGAKFNYNKEDYFYSVEAEKLIGSDLLLDEASVTGTANIVMAAVLAEGHTSIYNAACEPYLQQLCSMLNRMGAKIKGIGSNLLHIEGVKSLSGTEHTVLPDMIEIGSWVGLAAMTQSEITIKNVRWEFLGQMPTVFRKLGIHIEKKGDDIFIPAHKDGYEIQSFIDGLYFNHFRCALARIYT
jgi:UDP-N-acetylglucosamine 1-carboxyvinyltransferase